MYNFLKKRRILKIGKILQKTITYILLNKINNPYINNIIILNVILSKNLDKANIYIYINKYLTLYQSNQVLKILKINIKKIRFFISKMINLRIVPQIKFIFYNITK